jgi:hypothetical protein
MQEEEKGSRISRMERITRMIKTLGGKREMKTKGARRKTKGRISPPRLSRQRTYGLNGRHGRDGRGSFDPLSLEVCKLQSLFCWTPCSGLIPRNFGNSAARCFNLRMPRQPVDHTPRFNSRAPEQPATSIHSLRAGRDGRKHPKRRTRSGQLFGPSVVFY